MFLESLKQWVEDLLQQGGSGVLPTTSHQPTTYSDKFCRLISRVAPA